MRDRRPWLLPTKAMYMTLSKLTTILILWLGMVALLFIIERFSAAPSSWDQVILSHAAQLRTLWLDRLFLFITDFGSLYFLAPLTAVLAWLLARRGHPDEAWFLALSLGGASLVARLAKYLFQRARPDAYPHIAALPLDASFPSAHTVQITAFVFALCLIIRRLDARAMGWFIAVAAPIAVMVALSRLYLQVHYPSDVIGGVVLALLWVLGTRQLFSAPGIRAG